MRCWVIGAPSVRELLSVGAWLLVPALLSDLVLMPVAAVLSVLVTRHLPTAWRAPVTVGLALSAFVVLIGWPFIGGFGRHPDNPTLLNRDYLRGALVVLRRGLAGLRGGGGDQLRDRAAPITHPSSSG